MRFISVDIGNTHPHVGIFENGQLTSVIPLDKYSQEKDDIILVSSVKKENPIEGNYDLKKYFNHNHFFEMKVNYANTLGMDRLVCAYQAFIKNKNQKTLLIDAGTFMTLDLVDQNGFNGGYIFPGINTFLNSYTRGELLPKLDYQIKNSNEIPHSTNEAILSAVNIYLESCVLKIVEKTSPNRIVLTGGGTETVKKIISRFNLGIEILEAPHFLHQAHFLIYSRHLKYPSIP